MHVPDGGAATVVALFALLVSLSSTLLTLCHAVAPACTPHTFDWTYGQGAERTYILSNCHWWESIDHQFTTIITLLTLAHNTSSIAVIPPLPAASPHARSNTSLLGAFFNMSAVRRVQSAVPFEQFLRGEDFARVRTDVDAGGVTVLPLPKESQEEYEATLSVFGHLVQGVVPFHMPPDDPESTNQPCNQFGGTMYVSNDGKVRLVFLDRLHFFHFCTERFMPWWYDVRLHIRPCETYMRAARAVARLLALRAGGDVADAEGDVPHPQKGEVKRWVRRSQRRRPLVVVHVNDVMEAQRQRGAKEIQRYARDIVDALRAQNVLNGTLYIIHRPHGRNAAAVVRLLRTEFTTRLFDATDVANTAFPSSRFPSHKGDEDARRHIHMVEWGLGVLADAFVANIHSPTSRNIALQRKTHGKAYVAIRGFAELRKVWTWNL